MPASLRGDVALLGDVTSALDPQDAVIDDGPIAERELTAADELRPPAGLGAADRHQTRASLEDAELLAGAVEGQVAIDVDVVVGDEHDPVPAEADQRDRPLDEVPE